MADKSDSDEEYVPSKPCDLYQEGQSKKELKEYDKGQPQAGNYWRA